eukprot:UN1993
MRGGGCQWRSDEHQRPERHGAANCDLQSSGARLSRSSSRRSSSPCASGAEASKARGRAAVPRARRARRAPMCSHMTCRRLSGLISCSTWRLQRASKPSVTSTDFSSLPARC